MPRQSTRASAKAGFGMNDDGHLCALSHSAENSLVSKPLGAGLKTSVGGAGDAWADLAGMSLANSKRWRHRRIGPPLNVLLIEHGADCAARVNCGSQTCVRRDADGF
jgi:hypothetical protein